MPCIPEGSWQSNIPSKVMWTNRSILCPVNIILFVNTVRDHRITISILKIDNIYVPMLNSCTLSNIIWSYNLGCSMKG